MSYSEQFTCDVCGVQKKETNHWFLFSLAPTTFPSPEIFKGKLDGYIVFKPFDLERAKNSEYKHICGANCAQLILSQSLASLHSVESPKEEIETEALEREEERTRAYRAESQQTEQLYL